MLVDKEYCSVFPLSMVAISCPTGTWSIRSCDRVECSHAFPPDWIGHRLKKLSIQDRVIAIVSHITFFAGAGPVAFVLFS